MALDLSQVKNRLNKNLSKGKDNSESTSSFKDSIWKPAVGRTIIRIVPAVWNRDYPIKAVTMHSYDVFKKYVYSLSNWGEKDPVIEAKKDLYKDTDPASKEESFRTAKMITPKDTFYVPVIIRGQEANGVKLWAFTSKATETDLLTLMSNYDEYGDITDVMEGTDIIVDGHKTKMNNSDREYIACKLSLKRNSSKLSEDPKQVETWLTSQPDPLQFFKKYSFEEIRDMLIKWKYPETEDEGYPGEEEPGNANNAPVTAAKSDLPFDADEQETKPSAAKQAVAEFRKNAVKAVAGTNVEQEVVKGNASVKKSAADKFKAVFEEDEE